MSLKLSIIAVLYFVHGKFQKIIHFRLAEPVPPLDPGCHFDTLKSFKNAKVVIQLYFHTCSSSIFMKFDTHKH